jgi:Transcriptional regulatory protein, C terminal
LTISGNDGHRVCVGDDSVAPAVPGDGPFTLLIAVAASPDDRIRLAELVDGVAPLLLVSGLDELRRLITPASQRRTSVPDTAASGQSSTPPRPASVPSQGHGSGQGDMSGHGVVSVRSVPGQSDLLVIDGERSVARWRDREVALTRLELDLLICLNSDPLRTWSFADLHTTVWHSVAGSTGDVQSLVKRLRRKLDELGTSVTVDAVRGTGFRLSDHQNPTIRN